MVNSLNNALLVAAATVASVVADTESGSGSPHGHTYAVNVTFCETQYPMAKCYDSTTPEGLKRKVDEGLQKSCQGIVGKCTGQWPDGRETTKDDFDGHMTVALGPQPERPLERIGTTTYDTTDPLKHVRIAPTVMSHAARDVNKAMTVASGSCFPWAHSDSAPVGTDLAFIPLSARAWCGGSGDQPTVQFYKGGGCGEGTELGGENNKDDKGLIFNAPDTCGTTDMAADKDGPFAALGAFSCVQVVDSMNEFNTCASISATDEDVKGITGFPQADNNAVYTLATGVCAREPRAIDVSVWKQGLRGTATAVTQQDGTIMLSTSPSYAGCATMMTPVTANKDTKYSAKGGNEGAKCTMYGASKTPELCTDNTVTPPQRFMSYGGSNTRSLVKLRKMYCIFDSQV
jgi:hypothetical protein